MTTELTLREKITEAIADLGLSRERSCIAVSRIITLLNATGAPAYIRVADDLRGVVREEIEGGAGVSDKLPPFKEWFEVKYSRPFPARKYEPNFYDVIIPRAFDAMAEYIDLIARQPSTPTDVTPA